jgi:excisionase family DNA binding protein
MQSREDLDKVYHGPSAAWPETVVALLESLHKRLDNVEEHLSLSVVKDTYTVQEAAERLNRSDWTVRQWCNKGQVPGARKVPGKGRTGEWRIPHDALVKVQNDGPDQARR